MASRLRAELGDREIFRIYHVASDLHGNFYEDELGPEDVSEDLNDIEALLDKLEPLIGA